VANPKWRATIPHAPELVVEVEAWSRSRDLGARLKVYERMGVREYLIADISHRQFLWKECANGAFEPVEPGADGIFRSRFFPGLWLDPAALSRLDLLKLFAVVQQGLETPEHAAFVTRLAERLR